MCVHTHVDWNINICCRILILSTCKWGWGMCTCIYYNVSLKQLFWSSCVVLLCLSVVDVVIVAFAFLSVSVIDLSRLP